jgi:signal transduction histidine kinase
MKSHEALRGRERADRLARTFRRSGAPGNGTAAAAAQEQPRTDRAASGGHRRPGGHGPEDPVPGTSSRRPAWRRGFSLQDWRVRSRLLLLITVPVLVAVAFGGIAVVSSIRTAESYQQVQQLAVLAGDATNLAQALQNEREDTVTFIVTGDQGGRVSAMSASASQHSSAAPGLALLKADYATTDRLAAQVKSLAASIGGSYPALAQTQAQDAITAIGDLPSLRKAASGTRLPVLTVINDYASTITQLLTVQNEVAGGSKDAALANNVQVASLVSNMQEEASQQQAIVISALRPNLVGATALSAESLAVLNQQASAQAANLASFNLIATPAERQLYNSQLSSHLTALAQQQLQQASSLLASGTTSTTDSTLAVAQGNASYIVSSLGQVEHQLMSSIIAQSGSLRTGATATAVIEGVGVLLLLFLALALIAVVTQSMVGPLRRLRTGALEIANVRLPETVRLMGETDGEGVSLDVTPIDVHSADEIGEVARAFDQVHREALRLAANEAALRGNVNAMFVNLSRRSQSLVERQIRLISHLEQGEQDSKRLANLFQMDHLATLMRRNSENLLVLAGQDLSRRSNRPVGLVDVLRAALSEIEHYERVTVNAPPRVSVRAQAVSDVVHLTAELVENATSFSAAESPVTITARSLTSGGLLLEITDQGVGMAEDEMAHANWRLDNPPTVDVAVSRRMGLFVVARLAARHGIRVRLRPAETGGLVALVWLPDEAITAEAAGPSGLPRRTPVPSQDTAPGTGENGVDGAPRMPRFAPLRTNGDLAGTGPQPSAGDLWATGPQPAGGVSGTAPQPAIRDAPATGPQPVNADASWATGPQSAPADALWTTGPVSRPEPVPAPTGPLSLVRPPAGPPPAEPEADAAASTSQSGLPRRLPSRDHGLPSRDAIRSPSGVIVPPAEGAAEESRLPIFEAVESDWFRRVRRAMPTTGQDGEISNGWSSPADDGWRAAEVVQAPSSSGVTPAGLPKRQPRANLVPGAAQGPLAGQPAPAEVPVRSAAATRDRFASYQRGVRRARAAASGANGDGAEDETS